MKTKRHLAIEIFELILSGTESDRKHATNLILKLNDVERRQLRGVCEAMCYLIGDTWTAELCDQRIESRK